MGAAVKQKKRKQVIPAQDPERVVYAWPSRSRCPRCGSLDTERYSQDGATQYRRCRVPVCRETYKEQGKPA